jgi:hypothetical protein
MVRKEIEQKIARDLHECEPHYVAELHCTGAIPHR